ncbi:ECF transporter S component [Alkalibacterium psychrotolerans]|uniref:ECF transporter S component n=1 Tax=Alkalibacterium indicireducens TaxID=398758 RepID=A0ABN1B4E7_9LACT
MSMMVAVSHVGRLIFQFLPNVQPVTAILIILTLSMGMADGLIVAVLSILISNLTLGMGIWTVAQIVSYFIIILITGAVVRPIYQKLPEWTMIMYTAVTGLLYGFVISVIMTYLLGLESFWIYYSFGIPMDIMHALGNGAFYFILSPVLYPLIAKGLKLKKISKRGNENN